MYCPNCGKEIADKSKFCPDCGTKLEMPKEKSGVLTVLGWIFLIILFAALGYAAGYYLGQVSLVLGLIVGSIIPIVAYVVIYSYLSHRCEDK